MSYRRADSKDLTGRLADRLSQVRRINKVFLDTHSIGAGEDFSAAVAKAMKEASACIVVIGKQWLGGSGPASRIFEPDDPVRIEVATALKEHTRVLPVLANGATLPTKEQIPDDLHGLIQFHAAPLRHESFDADVEVIISALARRKPLAHGNGRLRRPSMTSRILGGIAGISLSGGALLAAAILHNAATQAPLEASLGGPGPVWLLIFAVLGLGVGIGAFWRRS